MIMKFSRVEVSNKFRSARRKCSHPQIMAISHLHCRFYVRLCCILPSTLAWPAASHGRIRKLKASSAEVLGYMPAGCAAEPIATWMLRGHAGQSGTAGLSAGVVRAWRSAYAGCVAPGVVCVEKSLSISALIANIDGLRSSIFHRLDVATSPI